MNEIFVFGSNLAGRHGKGAARIALEEFGAIYGQGSGRQGDSYAIPTKDGMLNTLSLAVIRKHVDQFLEYTTKHPTLTFLLTRIGCGLAGYKDKDIAPMFLDAPKNCWLPPEWIIILGEFKHGLWNDKTKT